MAGVRIGMDNIYFAIMTDEDAETYDTPVRIPGAVTATVTPTTNIDTFYADDKADEVEASLGDIQIEINPKDLPRDIAAAILGATIDSNGVLIQKSSDNAPYVALGWRSKKTKGAYRYYWYYKGKFQPNEEEFQTKEDTTTFQTPTIAGTFISRDRDSQWRARVDSDDAGVPSSTITDWFASVYESSADTTAPTVTVVPADAATGIAVTANIVWTFNETLRESTIIPANFFLIKATDGTLVAGALTVDADLKIVTFDPTASLSATTAYIAIATIGVKDIAGNPLAAPSVTNFTTT